MRILVIGEKLLARSINRALQKFNCQVTSSDAQYLADDLEQQPEVILIENEMGLVGQEVIRRLQALGYKGPIYVTQSEGFRLPPWTQSMVDKGEIRGTVQVPWDLQAIRAWAESILIKT